MNDTATEALVLVWLVMQLVGMVFTVANIRYFRPVLITSLDPPDHLPVDAEVILLARGHLRPEIERLLIFLLFTAMGLSVILRQLGVINHATFDLMFYGTLELGGAVLALKPILVFRDRKRLFRLDAEQALITPKENS